MPMGSDGEGSGREGSGSGAGVLLGVGAGVGVGLEQRLSSEMHGTGTGGGDDPGQVTSGMHNGAPGVAGACAANAGVGTLGALHGVRPQLSIPCAYWRRKKFAVLKPAPAPVVPSPWDTALPPIS